MTITVVGHRGAMGVEPENTIRSFLRAERDGADELEFDIRLSKDGVPVILHDANVDRTTDGSGPIADLTIDEIKNLDAGLGERIPSLDEVLDVVSLPLQVEIKDRAAVAATTVAIRDRGLVDRVWLTSFSVEALRDAAELFPESRRGLIMSDCPAHAADQAKEVGAIDVYVGLDHVTPELIDAFQSQGARVGVWPANDGDRIDKAITLNADAMTTNFPALARSVVDGSTGRVSD